MEFKPWPYQQRAINWIYDHLAAGLFLDMGMGKTVVTLTAVTDLQMTGEATRVLVIAPLRVAEDTWARECQKWDHLRHIKVSKILGTPAERMAALHTPADIYVINRENVAWLVSLGNWSFDTLVIDELSSFKSPASQRFKSLKKVRGKIHRVIGLTGTPAPNSLMDLWSQMFLLDIGRRLGRKIGEYREKYFTEGMRVHNVVVKWKLKPGAAEEIYAAIDDACLSMSSAEYLSLPDRLDILQEVQLPVQARAVYDKLEAELYAELKGNVITAGNAAVLAGKLLQASNGAIYNETHQAVPLHDAKLGALEDLIEASNGNPVLVFYSYQHDLERIRSLFPRARLLKTEKDIADWNDGKIEILLAHPASAGHGLNLQDGGHTIIWFGLPWSLELYQQANGRLHRQGQTHPVRVYHVLAANTIDQSVLKALQRKGDGQSALLEAVSERGKSRRSPDERAG
jgi:SNF2 family DNA or RNA helicase